MKPLTSDQIRDDWEHLAKPGMDIAELRRRYPSTMTCYGNLSVTGPLGDRVALDAELLRKIPFAAGGGFIMHSDHSIPFGVRCEQYRWACQRAQELFSDTRHREPKWTTTP